MSDGTRKPETPKPLMTPLEQAFGLPMLPPELRPKEEWEPPAFYPPNHPADPGEPDKKPPSK